MEQIFAPDKISQEWGSHLPALIACVSACDGPMLEIGCGHYSTPCLHAICAVQGKQLITLEVEDSWRNQFARYKASFHYLTKQTEDVLRECAQKKWGVVFVDDLAGSRASRAEMFFDSADFMLFHDCNFPQFAPALSSWLDSHPCNFRRYDAYSPHTLIVSKTREIPDFF